MKWTSAISEQPVLEDAIAECAVSIKSSVGNENLDLAIPFISPHYEDSYERVAELMAENLGARHVFGCSGGGVIGNGLEIEQRAGVSITAAILPNVDIKPFHLQVDKLPDMDAGPDKWETLFGVTVHGPVPAGPLQGDFLIRNAASRRAARVWGGRGQRNWCSHEGR